MRMTRERVAVIGSGIAGLTAAYLLRERYAVTLFEREPRLGGHAHTHRFREGSATVAVDSGFIVHNTRTYPNLVRLFGELGIRTVPSEMSLSVRCHGCGLEYAGGKGIAGLFAQPGNLFRPRFLRMLATVPRFHRAALRLLDDPLAPETTLDEFLRAGRFPRYFTDHLLLPLISAVWSANLTDAGRYPARYLFTFLRHHGLLSVGGAPAWRTVVGGSGEYVARIAARVPVVHRGRPVHAVHREANGVRIVAAGGVVHEAERVVIATHPDQALELLAEPSEAEQRVLGAFGYVSNETWLHNDQSVLPCRPAARGSWNYRKPGCRSDPGQVLVSYDLTRLMRLPAEHRYVVTLNATEGVDPDAVHEKMVYEHPIYTPESVAAQAKLSTLNDGRTAFAGAYHGWGFHEDGCVAGVRAAESFGVCWR
ncbi:FAD-dependent oxidoreductase [Sciscionella sediminilitoris]|uniref:NAD(P)/FAD-dependent oxidoreductase n=1 Tax=Sciscionella sediminilitoris TaxID=1445613 RepID=UPI0004DF8CAE